MEDDDSFATVLTGMQGLSSKRDPRSVRLAAVTAALLEVVGDDVSSTKVYAATVSALEGTLQQGAADSAMTQAALLELLCTTVPHISTAAMRATLSVTSRVLRAVVTFSHAANDETSSEDFRAANATLPIRGVVRASCEAIKRLDPTVPEKAVEKLFHGTILTLFEDRRPKVRRAAHNATCELLMMGKSCHPTVNQSVASYAQSRLGNQNVEDAHLVHLLSFLERSIVFLDRSVGQHVMELLLAILQLDTSATNAFIAGMSRKDVTAKISLVNSLLSVLVALLENGNDSPSPANNEFAKRVLASLLQSRPMVLFGSGSCDDDLMDSGRMFYGRVLLLSCQRVFQTDSKVGCKLFPLVIQMVIQLCRPSDEASNGEVAQALMVELTRTFRVHLHPMVELTPRAPELDQCLDDALHFMTPILHHSFRPTWSVTLQALAFLLHLVKEKDQVHDVVESLVQLHALVATDPTAREAVESAVGSLIQGIGIETFWALVTWKEPMGAVSKERPSKIMDGVIGPERVWLLPLLKTSSMSALPRRLRLDFFQGTILQLARKCDAFSAAPNVDAESALFHRARIIDLWSLFPCFCRHPTDLEATFPALSQTLVRAMGDARYPELVNIICGGLRLLAIDVDERRNSEGENNEVENGKGGVEQDAQVLAQAATKILPSLFKLVETIHGTVTEKKSNSAQDTMDVDEDKSSGATKNVDSQRSQSVIDAIAAFARLAPKSFQQSLFKKVMQRLLVASQSDEIETEKICTLLRLSQALLLSQVLDVASVSLLYRAVKPLIRTDDHEARVQKRAYKVLLEICNCHTSFVTEPALLRELTALLLDSIMTSQVSARHMRLKCMRLIVEGFDGVNEDHAAVIAKIVPEVLLCLKDSNGKAREAAYQLLISMAAVHENKTEILHVIIAALGAQTPHMRSAAVMAMSRIVFEYARTDESVYGLLPSLLLTVIVLFDEDSREVTKSVVGFVRVSVAAMTQEQLEPLLPELVGGILKYHKGKDRFRAKIKIILKKLVRVYGYDRLMPLVPEADTRLLTHIRKLSERAARQKAAQQHGPENNHFDNLMESDEEDSDDCRTLMTGATGLTKMTGRTGRSVRSAAMDKSVGKRIVVASTGMTSRTRHVAPRLRAEANGDVMDMLDPKMAKCVHFADDVSYDSDSDAGVMEFDETGRLVVPDDSEVALGERDKGVANNEDDEDEIAVPSKRQRVSKFVSAKAARDQVHKQKSKSKQVQPLGAAYKSRKAGGDVKKKGQKYEPYAYVPLDGKSYTKKNRRDTVERMSTVVKGGKRKRQN